MLCMRLAGNGRIGIATANANGLNLTDRKAKESGNGGSGETRVFVGGRF
jgi:hypothetical protein